jgi:hypothetical protein
LWRETRFSFSVLFFYFFLILVLARAFLKAPQARLSRKPSQRGVSARAVCDDAGARRSPKPAQPDEEERRGRGDTYEERERRGRERAFVAHSEVDERAIEAVPRLA